jgi:hypothetical protein
MRVKGFLHFSHLNSYVGIADLLLVNYHPETGWLGVRGFKDSRVFLPFPEWDNNG